MCTASTAPIERGPMFASPGPNFEDPVNFGETRVFHLVQAVLHPAPCRSVVWTDQNLAARRSRPVLPFAVVDTDHTPDLVDQARPRSRRWTGGLQRIAVISTFLKQIKITPPTTQGHSTAVLRPCKGPPR